MPSQPDFTLAYKNSPHLRPQGRIDELEQQNAILAKKLAQATKKKPEEVMKEVEQEQLPDAEQPHQKAKADEQEVAPVVTEIGAKFFANKNGEKYYPIERRNDTQFAKMNEKNAVYFKTAEEAEAADYVAA